MQDVKSFAQSELVLRLNRAYDRRKLDPEAWRPFLDRLCGDRGYQKEAIWTAVVYLASGQYGSLRDLAEYNYGINPCLRDKYAERSEGSRQLEEIEKYVQQLIREADIIREQKEQNVPDDEIWIDRTIAMLMAKWKIKWNKLTEVQQRSFKEVLMQSELRKEQLLKKRMRGRKR